MLTSMSVFHSASAAAHSVLTAEGTTGPAHPGINPPLNAAIVLGILLLLLFVTTRLNRDK
jgi:hypothetical protein